MQAIEENLDAARAEMEQVKTARDALATQLQQVLSPITLQNIVSPKSLKTV